MRVPPLFFFLWLVLSLVNPGCSDKEQPASPVRKPTVVKKSIPKAAEKPGEQEKGRLAAVQKEEKQPKAPEEAALGTQGRPEEKSKTDAQAPALMKPEAAPQIKEEERKRREEKSGGQEKLKAEREAKDDSTVKPEAQVKPALPQSRPEQKQVRVDTGTKAGPQVPVSKTEKPRGAYTIKKGETLAGIAGKEEVYGDSLKWPVLYRINLDVLGRLPPTEDMPQKEIPAGTKLQLVTPEERKKTLQKRANSLWVVNVISATTQAEIIPAVVAVVKQNYPVYITTARVKDKDWMRVRVGFFQTRAEAEAEGRKIMESLGFRDLWVTKVAQGEFAEFAGY